VQFVPIAEFFNGALHLDVNVGLVLWAVHRISVPTTDDIRQHDDG